MTLKIGFFPSVHCILLLSVLASRKAKILQQNRR